MAKDHIYGLATDFTTFYTECFVIGSEQEKSRLVLLEVCEPPIAAGMCLTTYYGDLKALVPAFNGFSLCSIV